MIRTMQDLLAFLEAHDDVIHPMHVLKHLKLIHQFGQTHYEKNAHVARTKEHPKQYMSKLIDLNMAKKADSLEPV